MEQPGTVLAGRYRVVRLVGSGGMGTVHLARDEVLDRDVAIKSVHAEPGSELGRRIMREARLGARLRHPHLVTVFDVIPEGGSVLLVTEYVEGETLAAALRRGPLEPARAVEVLRAVAGALDHAHAEGIVHRDVKPANVLLGAGGAIKLADLGIATAADATRITRTGGALGTVAYMAPEQLEPGPATPAVDVYALAAVAFEAFAGRRAYPGPNAFAVVDRLRDGAPPPDVREAQPDLPEPLARAIARGMATDPERRPATAGELVDGIEAAVRPAGEPVGEATMTSAGAEAAPAGATPAAAREPLPAARRRPRRPALAALALVGAGAVVAVLVPAGGDDPDRPARTTAERTRTATTTTATTARAPAGPATPEAAVRAFYERAAEGDLDGAWRLAGPEMRAAFGGSRDTFKTDLGSLRAIRFERLETTGATEATATVVLQTIAEHTDRTERCSGPVRTVRGRGGRWLVEPLGVRCVAA
jgi:hypothetical protein